MKIAYCDCFSGISGDMFLAAQIDAGLPIDVLRQNLSLLKLDETWGLEVKKVSKGAIQASMLEVKISESHHHRHLSDIQSLIDSSGLSQKVQQTSLALFRKLAEAEAQVHGSTIDEVHFHEVGAVDSILDIVGAAIGLDYFGIERLYASAVPMGSGQVKTQHGILPVPAPATLNLLVKAGAPVTASSANSELVTPTGAAILATLATFEQPTMTLMSVGTGAGQRVLPWPNILRLILGEVGETSRSGMVLIETNIDDMNPEFYGHILEKLFAAGALDVYMTPIYMKKNRPASILSVITHRAHESSLAQLLLRETTTFGVRVQPIYRYEAEREIKTVQTQFGTIPVKIKYINGEKIQAAPEYDICNRLANEHNVPIMGIYQAALLAAKDI
jgi:pyridinium-3,5-bisthiocarboxylic acid mononucleotide nickel chelatase